MNQMLAYMIKFWLVAIPVSVIFVMSFLIAYLLSFVYFPISILFGFIVSIFFIVSFVYSLDIKYFWRDLFQWSVEKKLDIKIQNLLKFLKEN